MKNPYDHPVINNIDTEIESRNIPGPLFTKR